MVDAERRHHWDLENMYGKKLRNIPGTDAKHHAQYHFANVYAGLREDPKVAEKIFGIAERYGAISAERLLEGTDGNLEVPGFDFFQLADLFGEAHRRIGRQAAGYWVKAYGNVIKEGFDPQEYFSIVDKMAELGGNRISGYFAYVFSDLLKAGQNPYEARSYTTQLVRRAGLPSARTFLLNVADVANTGVNVGQYGDFSTRALDEYGKNLGYWIIRGSASAALGGIPLEETKQNVDEMRAEFPKNGDKVASWFVSGYTGLGKARKHVNIEITAASKRLAELEPHERKKRAYWTDSLERDTNWGKGFDGYVTTYKDDYLKLARELGLSGGIFLSKTINSANGRPAWLLNELHNLQTLPDRLLLAKSQLSKKAFSRLLWFGPRLVGRPETAIILIDDVVWASTEFGDTVMLQGMAFSLKKSVGLSFELPHGTGKLLSGDNDTEGNWQNLLTSGTIFEDKTT